MLGKIYCKFCYASVAGLKGYGYGALNESHVSGGSVGAPESRGVVDTNPGIEGGVTGNADFRTHFNEANTQNTGTFFIFNQYKQLYSIVYSFPIINKLASSSGVAFCSSCGAKASGAFCSTCGNKF